MNRYYIDTTEEEIYFTFQFGLWSIYKILEITSLDRIRGQYLNSAPTEIPLLSETAFVNKMTPVDFRALLETGVNYMLINVASRQKYLFLEEKTLSLYYWNSNDRDFNFYGRIIDRKNPVK